MYRKFGLLVNDCLPYIIFLMTFLSIGSIFWPGEMTSDSWGQYNSALAGVYTNHHPAMMSFVWRHLFWIHPLAGGVYLLHMILFASSCLIFMQIFKKTVIQYFFALILLLPPILQFSFFIWKDVGMTFSYLFASSILAYYTIEKKSISLFPYILIILAFFYGTAIKYQGQFILIFLCFWLACVQVTEASKAKKIIFAVVQFVLILGFVNLANYYLVPPAKDSHSWQKVKIYDLSGISLSLNEPIYPDYILKNKDFDFKKVKELFNRYRVDELLFLQDTPVPEGKTDEDREALLLTWKKAVMTHPIAYLETRFLMWIHNFTDRPFKSSASLEKSERLNKYAPVLVNNKIFTNLLEFSLDSLRFIWMLPIALLYLIFGYLNLDKSRSARVLFYMNLSGISLAIILFVFSMAATARYVYFTMVMLHFSHPFAWRLWKDIQITKNDY